MAGSDITVEILKDIRDEIRGLRTDTNDRFDVLTGRFDVLTDRVDVTHTRLDVANARLAVVETTLLDMAEQQRLVVRYTRQLAERDTRVELRVSALEGRVDRLEAK